MDEQSFVLDLFTMLARLTLLCNHLRDLSKMGPGHSSQCDKLKKQLLFQEFALIRSFCKWLQPSVTA